jgi:REP element-mobilizing transposase RayT
MITPKHEDPLAFFLTWPTYGTWLPGDKRGWVEYQHGWQCPDIAKESETALKMTEDACLLTERQREIVEQQIAETCRHRDWHLHAASCRSNHIHVLVTALNTHPKKVQKDLKAWGTRRLKEHSDEPREKWWAERGSQRYINDEKSLEAAIIYVLEAQDRKHLDHQPEA